MLAGATMGRSTGAGAVGAAVAGGVVAVVGTGSAAWAVSPDAEAADPAPAASSVV
ncbi:MAG TPA: hypothetical protein VGO87_15005 [Acidimicrobiia bacterium]